MKKLLSIILFIFSLALLSAQSGTAHYNRGNAYFQKGLYEKAVEEYSKAISIDSSDIDALNNRGITYNILGLYDHAVKDFTRVVTLAPNEIFTYQSRAITYSAMERYREAFKDYETVLKLSPDFVYSYFALLYTSYYLSRKEFKAQYTLFKAQKELFKEREWEYLLASYITREIKLKELLAAAGDDPELLSDAYFTAGFVYLSKRWKRKAKEYFLKCREVGLEGNTEYFLCLNELKKLK